MKFTQQFLITFTVLQIAKCNIMYHNIIVKRNYTDAIVNQFYDLPAQFGSNIPPNGIRVYPRPAFSDGCRLSPSPQNNTEPFLENAKYVLVIPRNNCTFEEKVRNAQKSNYDAAIVYNIGSDELEQMSAKNGSDIHIPAVFVGETSGRYIIEGYIGEDNEFVLIINDDLPFNINTHLILPFSILVGLCFIIMIIYMIYKCIREQRRLRQHRLPKRLLKKIPIIKFDNHPYETCCICLEDYAKGDRLRILPCQHAYHCHCIDTWLTKNRRVCPICKRRVFVRETGNRRRSNSSESDSDDDTQPLINSSTENNTNNHGTFNREEQQNQPNPAVTQEVNQNNLTDDENILVNTNQRTRRQRVNPFDRQREYQGNTFTRQLARQQEQEQDHWNFPIFRWFGWFNRNSNISNEFINPNLSNSINNNNNNNNTSNAETVQATAIQMPRTASNNILNTNLSGSFKEDDDDDELLAATSIYEPIVNNTNSEQTDGDVFIATPSHGGLGVAALPNTNLNSRNASSF